MELACFPENGFPNPLLQEAEAESISPTQLDRLLADGWRHFGTKFFRYNLTVHEGKICGVLPLRIRLAAFEESKRHRRIRRKNSDLETRLVPAAHNANYDAMFERHKGRFTDNVPDSLRDFLSDTPAGKPCETLALELRERGALIAVSFFDVGEEATSGVYAMFEPANAARSPGIDTVLREIDAARVLGKKFHYLGYAYSVGSAYDYKKVFGGLEVCDWGRGWIPLPADHSWSRPLEVLEEAR